MFKLPSLKQNDCVEIIAPASRCSDEHLINLQSLLESWQLNCTVHADIFADDLLCANSDEKRFLFLKNALENPETKAVICARGGYGSLRLIPNLAKIKPPASPKLFLGMSDITALNLYFLQKLQWPVIHGALAVDKFSPESITATKELLFGKTNPFEFPLISLNSAAKVNQQIQSTITGGNLCLIQTSLGTDWQIDTTNKILFLEEIGERGYRIDRMLEQLKQAAIFNQAVAILFGDCLGGEEPDGSSLVQAVIERFALSCEIPVLQIKGIGHGYTNFPLSLGTEARLQLGEKASLVSFR